MSFYEIAGLTAGLLALIGGLLYILAILGWGIDFSRLTLYKLKVPTRPNRITWFIWTFVGAITVLSYYESGATHTVWFAAALLLEYFIAFVLSIPYGEGSLRSERKKLGRDAICLVGAAAAAYAWWLFDTPEIALFATIAIDFFGAWPTIQKAYAEPSSEDRSAWTFSALGSIVNMFAIQWEWKLAIIAIAAYPIYMLVANSTIAALLYLPRRRRTQIQVRRGAI